MITVTASQLDRLTARATKAEGELCACWAIATEGSPDDYKNEPGSARAAVDAMQDRLFAAEDERVAAVANAARLAEALRGFIAGFDGLNFLEVEDGTVIDLRPARAALAAHDAGGT
jgi:hypothetical protein